MTITKDDLELWRSATAEIDTLPHEKLVALCDLALVGLAVQPRPIGPAANGITSLVLHSNGEYFFTEGEDGFEFKTEYEAPKIKGHFVPTHYIPLSALPAPEVKP